MLKASGDVKRTNRFFFVLIAVSVLSPILLGWLFREGGLLEGSGIYQQTVIAELVLFLCALAFLPLGGMKIFRKAGLAVPGTGTILWIALLSFLIQPIATWINLLSMTFVENHVSQDLVYANGSMLVNLLYLALVPALVEEFISRGLFLQGLKGLGVRRAILISALMFALLHLNFNQFFYALLLGLVLALLVELTGSLYSSMLLHFLINARTAVVISSVDAVTAAAAADSSAGMSEMAQIQELLTAPNLLFAAAVYTPIMLLCLTGCIWVLRKIARNCGTEEVLETFFGGSKGGVRPPAAGMSGTSGTVCVEALPQEQTQGFLTIAFLAGVLLALVTMVLAELW